MNAPQFVALKKGRNPSPRLHILRAKAGVCCGTRIYLVSVGRDIVKNRSPKFLENSLFFPSFSIILSPYQLGTGSTICVTLNAESIGQVAKIDKILVGGTTVPPR